MIEEVMLELGCNHPGLSENNHRWEYLLKISKKRSKIKKSAAK
jgi:hypothetical protein